MTIDCNVYQYPTLEDNVDSISNKMFTIPIRCKPDDKLNNPIKEANLWKMRGVCIVLNKWMNKGLREKLIWSVFRRIFEYDIN